MSQASNTLGVPLAISRRGLLGLALAAIMALLGLTAASAQAAPVWDVKTTWAPTNLTPGESGMYYVGLRNLSPTDASSGTITVTAELPQGVEMEAFDIFDQAVGNKDFSWSCAGTSTVTCSIESSVEPDNVDAKGFGYPEVAPRLYFPISVAADAPSSGVSTVTVSGGGALDDATDVDQVRIQAAGAPFGMVPNTFHANVFAGKYPDQKLETQAGSHPYELRVDFDMSLNAAEFQTFSSSLFPPQIVPQAVEQLKTVETTLPRGLIGNPEAVPKCAPEDFSTSGLPMCPPETQVGTIDAISSFPIPYGFSGGNGGFGGLSPGSFSHIPVYNLEPSKGVAADFGFEIFEIKSHIYASLDPSKGYAITASTPFIPTIADLREVRFTMWGIPSDPGHKRLRAIPNTTALAYGADSSAPRKPFLTVPFDCDASRPFDQRVESYENPGVFTARENASTNVDVEACGDPRLRFDPDVTLQPTSRSAGGPTGLAVDLEVEQRPDLAADPSQLYPQNGDVRAIATPPMKKAVVTLPEGMTISTSAAQGLGNCSPSQISMGTNDPVTCPSNSQYGTLTLKTPILPTDKPMTGRIYVAKQNDNPFNNFLSLYLVIEDPDRGLLVKIPGRVDLDPVTGQIRTTFDDLPQFPVSNMQLQLKGGVRAALVNPPTCGTKKITAEFFSWHDPNTPITETSSYEITQKPDGSPCVKSLGERQFKPDLTAGTVSNSAGSYSPFVFRLQRGDDDQEFSQLGVTLAKGLLAKIRGISKCSDAAIAAADAAGRTGTQEANSPSCPASSQIGTTDVGSGVGQVVTYIPGKVYLAGPYRGAPLSMVVITPILAGPYDLGVIAVRSTINVNTDTTEATVQTDPFPQIFKGIPVRIKDIRVKVDRADTMINPTNCNPLAINSHVTGTGGDVNTTADDTGADLSERFQVSNCGDLPFAPKLSFKLRGGTHRGDYPAFTATLKARPGDANIARTAVTLPHSEFLAQEHIRTICTRVQFAAKQCPAGSVYGYAKATSPLFDETLQGPVFLRSSSNRLPDLVATLNGEIDVVLSGRIDAIDEQIRNTFDVVPDAPVTKFTLTMQGGKKGLLVNSRNLCKAPSRADVKMTGQNGKRSHTRPLVVASACKKAKNTKSASARRDRERQWAGG